MNPSIQTSQSAAESPSSLSIGQVIYILSHKAQTVVPAVVVEEVIVKKINGNQTSWKVSIGPKDKNRVVDSTKIDGEIFTSLDDVRNILMERFQQYVNNLIIETERRVETWYGLQASSSGMVSFDQHGGSGANNDGKIDPESLIHSIEGNARGPQQVRTSTTVPTSMNAGSGGVRNDLRNKIRELAKGEESEQEDKENGSQTNDDPNMEKQLVKMPGPDGTPMLVSVKVPVI